jgi:ubiquinone/menaquinone biosynthesis C-methylase UbiE
MDFGPLAPRYDELRPAGPEWYELAELTLAELAGCRRLLDVGCGTGRFAALAADRLGARVWGVDPSAEMLEAARRRAPRIGWKQAHAERLPFRDGWFDGVHARLVLHLVERLDDALAEMARVLGRGGRAAVVSFDFEHFDRFHLNPYFPSLADLDRARFPEPAAICAGLERAGLADARHRIVRQPVEVDPVRQVERVRGRYISSLHLLDPAEYAEGLAALERDMAGRDLPIETEQVWSLVTARRP